MQPEVIPPPAIAEGRTASWPMEPGDRKRPLVLAVEDRHHDWLMYGKLLWYNGFDVLRASDAGEGLTLARETTPDVILADLMLPDMNGIEMCRHLREERATREIPVVVLTARSEREFGEAARQAGCARFLEKPIGPVEVLHVIEDIVGRPPPPAE